jgi:hypothetical protein
LYDQKVNRIISLDKAQLRNLQRGYCQSEDFPYLKTKEYNYDMLMQAQYQAAF